MSFTPPKLMFDECVPRTAVANLISEIDNEQIWDHVVNKYRMGEKDEIWIPKIAIEGDWIVISGDKGSHTKRHERKLPELCVECAVTHVILSSSVHEFKVTDKIECFRSLWDDIIECGEAEPGSRFVIRLDNNGENPHLERRQIAKRNRKPRQ